MVAKNIKVNMLKALSHFSWEMGFGRVLVHPTLFCVVFVFISMALSVFVKLTCS
jgi:hypothetical protein